MFKTRNKPTTGWTESVKQFIKGILRFGVKGITFGQDGVTFGYTKLPSTNKYRTRDKVTSNWNKLN